MTDRKTELTAAAGGVSRETYDSLVRLEAEVQKWNRHINLVSPGTIDDLWARHILDSAQIMRLGGEAKRWVDLGSGGGFPGLVIAIFLREREGASITMVESNHKKSGFLRHVIGLMSLPADVVTERIEAYGEQADAPEIVTARALASLPQLLDFTRGWIDAGSTCLFHKGRDFRGEIEQSNDITGYSLIEHQSVVDADSVILEIRRKRAD